VPEKMWTVSTILFFHNLFTVVWIGGMITLGLGMVPVFRRVLGAGPQTQRIMSAFQSRYRWFAYVCIVGLAVTGFLLSRRSPEFQAFFAWDDTYSILLSVKHILMIIMVVIVLVRSVALIQRAPGTVAPPAPAGDGPSRPSGRVRLSMLLLFVNILFGVVVLFLSAATATIGSA